MNINNMKNIVIIKNLPSNLVEEAIVVIKNKSRALKLDEKKLNRNKNIIFEEINESEFEKIKNIQKDNRKYVVKEAEMVVSDYLEKIDENKKFQEKIKIKRNYKRAKFTNFILGIISIVSIIICFFK